MRAACGRGGHKARKARRREPNWGWRDQKQISLLTTRIPTMGLDTAIRTHLRDNEARSAFSTTPPESYTVTKDRRWVTIVDSLTVLRSCPDAHLTGDQIFQRFFELSQESYEYGDLQTIQIIDYSPSVPAEKKEEQDDRKEKNPYDPYPDGCSINDQGLVNQDGIACGPIMCGRLMCTGYMRPLLCKFLESKLKTMVLNGDVKQRTIFQFGPIFTVAESDTDYLRRFSNFHGEADTSIPRWIDTYSWNNEIKGFRIESSDSDQMAILPLLVANLKNSTIPIYWTYKEKVELDEKGQPREETDQQKKKRRAEETKAAKARGEEKRPEPETTTRTVWVDIRELVKCIEKNLGLNMAEFVHYAILCGTDFVKKRRLCPGFGFEAILEGFMEYKEHATVRSIKPKDSLIGFDPDLFLRIMFTNQVAWLEEYDLVKEEDGYYSLSNIREAVKMRTTTELNKKKAEALKKGKTPDEIKYCPMQFVPSEEDLEKSERLVNFNFRYWAAAAKGSWLDEKGDPVDLVDDSSESEEDSISEFSEDDSDSDDEEQPEWERLAFVLDCAIDNLPSDKADVISSRAADVYSAVNQEIDKYKQKLKRKSEEITKYKSELEMKSKKAESSSDNSISDEIDSEEEKVPEWKKSIHNLQDAMDGLPDDKSGEVSKALIDVFNSVRDHINYRFTSLQNEIKKLKRTGVDSETPSSKRARVD